jgi:hypothetical protein
MADETDALRRLEERLDRAAEAAERLLADAVARAAGSSDEGAGSGSGSGAGSGSGSEAGSGGAASGDTTAGSPPKPPLAGWQLPGASGTDSRGGELDLLVSLLNSVRDRIPPELQKRLAEAIREVLLALRALIDWYLERGDRPRRQAERVQDIPIL